MPEEKAPVLLEPSPIHGEGFRIFSIRKTPRTRKHAKSRPAIPEEQSRHEPTDEEIFDTRREDRSHESDAIQRLMETARGVALILSSFHGGPYEALAWSLAIQLKSVVDPVDAYYFGSLGEVNDAIDGNDLQVLLKRKLKTVRAKLSASRKKR